MTTHIYRKGIADDSKYSEMIVEMGGHGGAPCRALHPEGGFAEVSPQHAALFILDAISDQQNDPIHDVIIVTDC